MIKKNMYIQVALQQTVLPNSQVEIHLPDQGYNPYQHNNLLVAVTQSTPEDLESHHQKHPSPAIELLPSSQKSHVCLYGCLLKIKSIR